MMKALRTTGFSLYIPIFSHTHRNTTHPIHPAPEAFVHAVGQIIEAWGPTIERGLGLPGEAAAVALLLDEGGASTE